MDPRARHSDFDITKVDFEWVKSTSKLSELRKALKALQQEGGFEALEKAITDKIAELHPSA